MGKTFFFENIKILMGPHEDVCKDSILIVNGKIKAFGEEAKKEAFKQNITQSESANKLVAPLLVDSHSILNNPLTGINDDLENLKLRAKKSGFGSVTILPNSNNWRDQPEKIPFQKISNSDINIYFWGSFSLDGKGMNLSPHNELLNSGVVGLEIGNCLNSTIIAKGLTLDSIKSFPVLFSLNPKYPLHRGMVYKDLQSLQSGFYVIENNNETFDIKNILGFKNIFQDKKFIIKNISDANSLKELNKQDFSINVTVSWWNLVADTNNLKFDDLGWKVDPPLGSHNNRNSLIKGLEDDLIQAIAVNSVSLNDENTFTPINQRKNGISTFELVLPLLWRELIIKRKWSILKLWKHLSFNPSNLLGISEEKICLESNRWLIFDPDAEWLNNQINLGYDTPSNFPMKDELIKGKVVEVGLNF